MLKAYAPISHADTFWTEGNKGKRCGMEENDYCFPCNLLLLTEYFRFLITFAKERVLRKP